MIRKAVAKAAAENQASATDGEFAALAGYIRSYNDTDTDNFGVFEVDEVGHFEPGAIVFGFGVRAVAAGFLANIHSLDLSHVAGKVNEKEGLRLVLGGLCW